MVRLFIYDCNISHLQPHWVPIRWIRRMRSHRFIVACRGGATLTLGVEIAS